MVDEKFATPGFVTITAVVIAMALLGYGIYQRTLSPAPPKEARSLSYASIVKLAEGIDPSYSLDVEHPQFTGLGREHDSALNESVEQFVSNEISLFESMLTSSNIEAAEAPNNLTLRYRVLNADERFVSVEFIRSSYVSGAAHPDIKAVTLNWIPTQKIVIEGGELFKPGSAYLERLSDLAREKLALNHDLAATASLWEEGLAPTRENYGVLGVRGDSLIVFFNPYQIAPYAAGIIEISIPLHEINDIVLIQ